MILIFIFQSPEIYDGMRQTVGARRPYPPDEQRAGVTKAVAGALRRLRLKKFVSFLTTGRRLNLRRCAFSRTSGVISFTGSWPI